MWEMEGEHTAVHLYVCAACADVYNKIIEYLHLIKNEKQRQRNNLMIFILVGI